MSTTNDPMRKTPVRPSRQFLEDILQAVEAKLIETVESLKGIKTTAKGILAKPNKTIENVEGLDKQPGDFGQADGTKLDKMIEEAHGLSKKLDEHNEQLDKLANLVAILTAASNTTLERAKL